MTQSPASSPVGAAAWALFIEAADLGSLSKVALARGTSQPHISRQIAALEAQCGGRLFQRHGRGVELTELGRRVAPKVRAWLASTEQLVNDIRSSAGKPIGRVRLGILPSAAHPLVSTLYYRLREQHPGVQLMVREGQGAQLETWLEDGSLDLALLYRFHAQPRGGDEYLAEVPTWLVGAPGDALTAQATVPFAALNGLPLVTFCRPSRWRDRLDHVAAERGVALNVVLEADSLGLQLQVAADGGAHALLGRYAIEAALNEGRVQAARLVRPEVRRYTALAMAPHGELTLACRTVMQALKAVAEDQATAADHRA